MEGVEQLQQEWRAIVLKKLDSLEVGQTKLASDIVDIKMRFVQQEEVTNLRTRVDSLENFKFKLAGMAAGINLVLVVIGWIVLKIFK